MKKSLQIHVRVTPATRQQWNDLCAKSKFNTQSAQFRSMVEEMYDKKQKTTKNDENEQ